MKTSVRAFLFLSIISISASWVASQSVRLKDQEKPAASTPARPNADETFDLNIDVRRISRENFEASTSVATDEDSRLNLQIGVSLAAGRIEVLLKNVQGRVRFRGSLDRILEMIDTRRPAQSPTPSPK